MRRSGTSDGRIKPDPIDPEVLRVVRRSVEPVPTRAALLAALAELEKAVWLSAMAQAVGNYHSSQTEHTAVINLINRLPIEEK